MDWINTLIVAHAGLGGIALLAGLITLAVRKGSQPHVWAGRVFFGSMLGSILLALLIALLPDHRNNFLLAIGIFSLYFLATGFRATRFKNAAPNLLPDRIGAMLFLINGLVMIGYPLVMYGVLNPVLAVFGVFSLVVALRDLRQYQHPEQLKALWMRRHLGHMIGAYIAATTAFVVVNDLLPGMLNWFAPSVVGGMVIAFWLNKLKPKR